MMLNVQGCITIYLLYVNVCIVSMYVYIYGLYLPVGYGVACACELGSLVPTDHFGSQKHVHFAAQNRCSSLPAGKSQMTTAWFAHKCM